MSKAKERALLVLKLLDQQYPLEPALNYTNTWELLVAVMLSAQTTDEKVNQVTPMLFNAFPTPQEMVKSNIETIEAMIKTVNYYKTKARHLHKTATILKASYHSKVPDTMEDLLGLPGVARKTANVVLTHGFGKLEGIVVDTHVIRLVHRLRLSKETQREKIETSLMKIVPGEQWGNFATLLVFHGRRVCKALKPLCAECRLNTICPSKKEWDLKKSI